MGFKRFGEFSNKGLTQQANNGIISTIFGNVLNKEFSLFYLYDMKALDCIVLGLNKSAPTKVNFLTVGYVLAARGDFILY